MNKVARIYLSRVTVGACLAAILLWLNPVHSKLLNLIFLGSLSFFWFGCMMLFWNRKVIRGGLFLLLLIAFLPFLLPGRPINAEELSGMYVHRITRFEGTKYVWGGENFLGIDCSGLPRRAYRDALLTYGLLHANGQACRLFLEQWWFDASARALGEGYLGYTNDLKITGNIEDLKTDDLELGDLAVTVNGIHILAYVGEGQWIQADPGIGHVKTLYGKKDKNAWFTMPVSLHRWSELYE